MKAIIIAAGMGTRLRPHTADRPKCMVEVHGKPILHHQIDALRANGVDEIVVIGGYKRSCIQAPDIRIVANPEYQTNNILMSLFCAGPELVGDVVVSYGDIVYGPGVVQALMNSFFPNALVVDFGWEKIYEGRTDHPIEQAELCEIRENGHIVRVGKEVGGERACGEFIGLAKFDGAMIARLWARYRDVLARGDSKPYVNAPTLRKAYLTDLVNDAIANQEHFGVVPIDGDWREIDTVQDYDRVQASETW
ncbi:MAG: hypothetical protein CMH52_03920 [Myxococcales bacterium]|nr:hypothetical protein [Myxococcales bacterium]|tara:strand:+ start:2220 stop:2969 length:750 start_codon:yes stop_codon:yes gene_type:complete